MASRAAARGAGALRSFSRRLSSQVAVTGEAKVQVVLVTLKLEGATALVWAALALAAAEDVEPMVPEQLIE